MIQKLHNPTNRFQYSYAQPDKLLSIEILFSQWSGSMNKQANEDNAIWGTMTLALPQVTEWNIEGTGISKSGTNLRTFLNELNAQGNGKPVTLSINLLMSLGSGEED